MYNRYIPEDTSYTPVEARPPRRPQPQPPIRFPDFLSNHGEKDSLSSLLKTLRLDRMDSGDLLLLLIVLYLLVEGEDLDPVIALGLVLLMGLGEE